MELIKLRKDQYMLRTTPQEALMLIESLAIQIKDKDPNTHRKEFSNGKGFSYFSISVKEPDGIRCDVCGEGFDTWSDVRFHKIQEHQGRKEKK